MVMGFLMMILFTFLGDLFPRPAQAKVAKAVDVDSQDAGSVGSAATAP
jgi:hypothetical protein